MRSYTLYQILMSLFAGALAMLAFVHPASAASDQEQLVSKAEATLKTFQNDPQMTWIRTHLKDAKAVMIAPEVRRAGFVLGGSGGRAVLVARDPAGKWSGPAFYTLATASIGFQAGVDKSEVVMLVMTEKGLTNLLNTQMKLGGDASIAAGPVGKGAQKDFTTDIVSFSRAKGLYGGVNLDGTLVKVNQEWNDKYFGQAASPVDILVRHSVHTSKGDRLVQQVSQAAHK
jgi:lipid-binding SYLF domain-containing protein